MAKTAVSQWSTTAADNTDVGGVNIAEGMAPSDVNNALRELMAQLRSGVALLNTSSTFTVNPIVKDNGAGSAGYHLARADDSLAGTVQYNAAEGSIRLVKRDASGVVQHYINLLSNATEVGTSTGAGSLSVGRTNANAQSRTTRGVSLGRDLTASSYVLSVMGGGSTDTVGTVMEVGRAANTYGNLLMWTVGATTAGTVSVDGSGVVTYGTFCGVHWAQFSDNARPELLAGTILETIDEMCAWAGEDNAQLARVKVSDTAGSKAVYGVFSAWDTPEGKEPTNDLRVASLGAYVIRIAAGVSVQIGDLIESNGDGCGRVQADDVFRSSTVAKVTATHHSYDYPDGSYCVPCTLRCG